MIRYLVVPTFLFILFSASAQAISEDYLTDFYSWESVTPQEKAFKSAGHPGGPLVRAYFNEIAATTYKDKSKNPVVFSEGAILAKAVLTSESQLSQDSDTVFFMEKMAPMSLPESNDWSFAVAKRGSDGLLKFVVGMDTKGCVSCHSAMASDYDFALTVDLYRKHNPF